MEQTGNYQLNLWEGEDRILREDFNADNVKTEAALAEVAEQLAPITAQIGKLGNCQVYTTTYTGTGTIKTISMTFPGKPMIVMISGADGQERIIFWRAMSRAPLMYSSYDALTITWGKNSASWYSNGNAELGLNENGATYYVAALLDMSEE